MTAERESMTLQEMDAPALGVEERRDEAPRGGASHARPTPDPEVVAKPKRCKFTAQYRLRILEEAESCTQPGEVGRLLRREGLYSSHLTEWRRARREGSLQGLTPSKRGRKPAERNLSLPFISSAVETLEFCIPTGYLFRHAQDHQHAHLRLPRNRPWPRSASHRNPCPATAGSCPETEKAPAIASEGG